jgi:uncharacterized protein YjbI with pentapeptide repeats
MSDEQPADEPKIGIAWGDAISEERQAKLRELADQQREWAAQPEVTRGDSVFKGVTLTGADVFWLAERVRKTDFLGVVLDLGVVPDLHLEAANLSDAHLEGAILNFGDLKAADLSHAYLEGAILIGARMQEADLLGARLERANLNDAHLEGAKLVSAQMQGAILMAAHLEGAILNAAHLEGAMLVASSLERADLGDAHLEGANLGGVRLEGADLRGSFIDTKTLLTDSALDSRTRLGDIHWGGVGSVDLTQINWTSVARLGDETELTRDASAFDYEIAVRAYRQLAAQLRAQGMTEVADWFAYRAQVVQRRVLRGQGARKWLAYVGSLLLDFAADYGYRPAQSFLLYVAVIVWFANCYVWFGHLPADGAVVFSVTSFHGRGFSAASPRVARG